MANHFLLFGRPLAHDAEENPLSIVGMLEDYNPGDAYLSELDVVNSVGRVTLEILESTLPPGASVRVDNVRKKIVVKWPAYVEKPPTATIVPNGGFEDGDDGTWTLGPGWSIEKNDPYNVETGQWSAKFADYKTKGSSIYGPRLPAKVNDSITFNARIQQGASSKGNAGARCHLVFRDAAGAELSAPSGPMVSSGSGGEWKNSGLTVSAPGNTATVEVWIPAYRNKQNKPLFVDNVTWNHEYSLGQQDDKDYYLKVRITDGLNRTAEWEGTIYEFSLFVSSGLYPVTTQAALSLEPVFAYGSITQLLLEHYVAPDSVAVHPVFVSGDVREAYVVTSTMEAINVSPLFASGYSKDVQVVTDTAASIDITPVLTYGYSAKVLVTATQPVDSIAVAPYFAGGKLT